MENKLKNIKKTMNETIFHDISFSEKNQQNVFSSIKESDSSKKLFNVRKGFNNFLSLAVTSFLFLGIAYFVGTKTHILKGEQRNQHLKPQQESNKEGTVYIPPKQEENFKDMTKEEILTKMINTVDYFETAKGEFKIHYGYIDSRDDYSLIDYELSLKNNAGGYSKITDIQNGKETVTYHYYKDGTMWDLNQKSATYNEVYYMDDWAGATLKIEDAFSKDDEVKYRGRPPIVYATDSLFPYEIVSKFTRNMDKWEIEKQNEMLLGHNTLVIKGNLNRRDFQSFRFWVDKDTGILVKYETYNSSGKVVEYLHPKKLEINVPIDSKRFKPNLAGYEKEGISRKDEPKMTTGNIDEFIPVELKLKWEEAKKKPNETTILHLDDKWYICAKKGYLVDRIETDGREGTLYLAKVSPQKSQFIFHAMAEGYKVDKLKVVYE
ncbi:hypothetical protein J6TS2_48380 [Heyndrickxia sporothermodurans]|nr:hypothetical protein J6TS2_48380 [Heyndrickxia sporothermodurans]